MTIMKSEGSSPRLLGIKEVAERWGVSVRTVQRLVKDDRLKAIKIGRQARFRLQDVLDHEMRHRS